MTALEARFLQRRTGRHLLVAALYAALALVLTWPLVRYLGTHVPGSYTWAFDEKLVKPFIPDKGFYATDAFTDWALEWLGEARSDDGGIDKFFVFLETFCLGITVPWP